MFSSPSISPLPEDLEAPPVVTAGARIYYPLKAHTDIGGKAHNQDRALINSEKGIIAVFDGHGIHGAEFAEWAATITGRIELSMSFEEQFALMEVLTRAQFRAHLTVTGKQFLEDEGFYIEGRPISGGTTATVIRIEADGSVACAAAGDSEAFVFDDGSEVPLTVDHSPLSLTEWTRIKESHPATLCQYSVSKRPVWLPRTMNPEEADSWFMNPIGGTVHVDVRGTWSTYIIEPYTREALAMTRSIGDFNMKSAGVSAVPTVVRVGPPRPGTMRAVVVGSDGLWNCLQYSEVRDLVRSPALLGKAEAATHELLLLGRARASLKWPDTYDNIICIVTYVSVA